MPGKHGIEESKLIIKPDTIASGTDSAEIDLLGGTLVGIIAPSGISSSTFTINTLTESGGTEYDLISSTTGVEYTGNIAAGKQSYIEPTVAASLGIIKVTYSASETAKTFHYVYRSIE
jgi:hypothetical protein